MSFFEDSDGNQSYGRLASFILVLASIGLAFVGRDYGVALASALGFYSASKATQALTTAFPGDKSNG